MTTISELAQIMQELTTTKADELAKKQDLFNANEQ